MLINFPYNPNPFGFELLTGAEDADQFNRRSRHSILARLLDHEDTDNRTILSYSIYFALSEGLDELLSFIYCTFLLYYYILVSI